MGSQREEMWATFSKVIGVGLPKSFVTHRRTLFSVAMRHGTIEFTISSLHFGLALVPSSPSLPLFLHFERRICTLVHGILDVRILCFNFYWGSQ